MAFGDIPKCVFWAENFILFQDGVAHCGIKYYFNVIMF